MRTTVGGWTLISKLASGGMGSVWKATRKTDVGMPLLGALKIPLAHVAANERETRRFLDEARMLMSLDHPNVVRVIDAGVDEQLPYMVMQWVNGVDLLHLRKAVHEHGLQFSVGTSLFIASSLLSALNHAHTREVAGKQLGIVHRDVKPANVLISTEGQVMLGDFGVACMHGDDPTGNAHGTPRYMSPEQFRGQSSHQSDLWGVGAVLWEMLAGIPFRGELSSQQVLDHLARECIVSPPPLRGDFSIYLMHLLTRLLVINPDFRFTNADDALLAVEQCGGAVSQYQSHLEIKQLLRQVRLKKNSEFTKLMGILPEEPNLELEVIFSVANDRFRESSSEKDERINPDPEDPEDPTTPQRIGPLPNVEQFPVSEYEVMVGPHPDPEPDAPTTLRRPGKPRRMDATTKLPPWENPSAEKRGPTEMLSAEDFHRILGSTRPPLSTAIPWAPLSSWPIKTSPPQSEPDLISLTQVSVPFLASYQKWFFGGLLFFVALLTVLVTWVGR